MIKIIDSSNSGTAIRELASLSSPHISGFKNIYINYMNKIIYGWNDYECLINDAKSHPDRLTKEIYHSNETKDIVTNKLFGTLFK